MPIITKAEFETLARFRKALREFLRFSELAARREGLTPQQHQLLLAIKGMPDRDYATITEVAKSLQLRHNAAVQLINRAQSLGLVERASDTGDRRVVRVGVSAQGDAILARLVAQHRDELRRLSGVMEAVLSLVSDGAGPARDQG